METDMLKLRRSLIIALALTGSAALAQAQTATSGGAQRAATAPGVTRAVEHPDTTDTAADQTRPDSHQPETATDPQSSGPETAKDDTKLKPETATDAPKLSATQQAAEQAKQGVRSNTPPSSKP
jgi:hypothetical protein